MQFKRLFTQAAHDPYGLIHFRQPEAMGDGFDIPLEHPDHWSLSAVELFAEEAAANNLPSSKKPVEENTVPSWLWRQAPARSVGKQETRVRHVFDRVVGAAAYQGWKQNIFSGEPAAKNFYDEARYALAQRFIGFEPAYLATLGLDWAYGVNAKAVLAKDSPASVIDVSNAVIDVVVSGRRDRATLAKWEKITARRGKAGTFSVRFSDTEAQWEAPVGSPVSVSVNLMAFRHNDGSLNIEALRHAVRLAVMLVDLHHVTAPQLSIGFCNLAPLLMALAIPYDSEAARATAAAIAAIMSAEAYSIAAELAALRGAADEFSHHREDCMRALRNHRRAAYGERNDYEKISVTPSPLAVEACPDLALTAAARNLWDQVLELAQKHGLRYTQVTGFSVSPALTLYMESESDGSQPLRSLTLSNGEGQSRVLHPSVIEALSRLSYDSKKQQAFVRHVTGFGTLDKAPLINHTSLRARGFTAAVLEKIEAYLPHARNLRHVFTPWVVGVDFCRKVLKIPASKLDNLRFNLLAHLGFTEADIGAANVWVYGHDKVDAACLLRAHHAHVFATSSSMPSEAYIRMAAAVQGMVSGETALALRLPLGLAAERFEKLILDAWRRGVKSLSATFDPDMAVEKSTTSLKLTRRKGASKAYLRAKAPVLPKRQSRSALARLEATRHSKAKIRGFSESH